MHTVLVFVGFLIGLVLLIKGADIFVDAGVGISRRLHISPVLVAITLVSMGTSLPELVISVTAAFQGANDLAVANVVGANSFNLVMILGLAAIVRPFPVRFKEVKREYWLSVGAAVFLVAIILFTPDDIIPRYASAILLVVYVAYIVYLIRTTPNTTDDDAPSDKKERKLTTHILFSILAIALIGVGGWITVWSAESMGPILGISERVVGLTIVAISTSLPELTITLLACKRGENEMAVGTIVGSNIFNIMAVLGVSGIILPLAVSTGTKIDLAFLIAGSLLFFLFVTTRKRLSRVEGAVMVVLYIAYLIFLLVGVT
ncbi:MAG: calcium/sodium antiporter [Defluviitaleaceae bacterium]|nr:calcium/sodium antiporter [Defluviitaleaceae bacterium]MCL2274812.1 calcium/sodium antiporter [Defluviitaleaceae bacterium]